MTRTAPPPLRHIAALDGLRGCAILLVIVYHCFETDASDQGLGVATEWFMRASRFGFLGVDLFFVLSGFLITTLLLEARRSAHYYRNFYIKRVFRILPPFLLVLAIARATSLIDTPYALLSLFFAASFFQFFRIPQRGPFWSLAIEEQFYLVWPLLVRKLRLVSLYRVLFAVALVEPVLRFVLAAGHHTIVFYSFTRSDGLAWGAWLALEVRRMRLLRPGANRRIWWKRYGRVLAVAGVTLVIASKLLERTPAEAFAIAVMLTAAPPLFTALLGFVLVRPQSWLAAALRMRWLRFWGDISYGAYLIHLYIIWAFSRYYGIIADGQSGKLWLRFGVTVALTTVLAALSLYFYERPVMRMRRRFLR